MLCLSLTEDEERWLLDQNESRSRQSAPTSTAQNPKMGFFVSVRYNDTMLQRMTQPQFWKQLLKNGPMRLVSFHVLDTTLGRWLKILPNTHLILERSQFV